MKKLFLPLLFVTALLTPAMADDIIPVTVSDSGSTLALAAIGLTGLGLLARRFKHRK